MYKCCNALSARDEFLPVKEEAIRSILDYDINIYPLNPEDTSYTALNMNYSVAGFQLVLTRKASFYVVTYYLPSGLFVVVSWISFLINPDVGKKANLIFLPWKFINDAITSKWHCLLIPFEIWSVFLVLRIDS